MSLVGRALAKHAKSPGSIPALHKPGMGNHACESSTQDVEAGGGNIQGHLQLHTEFAWLTRDRFRTPPHTPGKTVLFL